MPEEARGIISGEELQAYNSAGISLLDGNNDTTGSGNYMITGKDQFTWVLRWTENGFTNYSWNVGTWNNVFHFQDLFNAQDGSLEEVLKDWGGNISYAMNEMAEFAVPGCGGLQRV